jgi:hypothetical protein
MFRNMWSTIESILYDAVSKAASLVDGWADRSLDNNKLLSQVEMLGSYAMVQLALTDSQIQLPSEMSRLGSDFTENWLIVHLHTPVNFERFQCIDLHSPRHKWIERNIFRCSAHLITIGINPATLMVSIIHCLRGALQESLDCSAGCISIYSLLHCANVVSAPAI